MKISVKSIVKSLINDNMKSLGFKCKDNIYYRHINGVLQGFKIYSRDMCYTIRFASYPLCSGITRDPGIFENHEITVVLPERREVFFHIVPWGETITEEMQIEAWNNRETKYVEIANQLAYELNNYLLPQLLEITSPQSAFEFEKRCYISHIRFAHDISEQKAEKYYNANYKKIYWSWYLQMKEYDKAKQNLKEWLQLQKYYDELSQMHSNRSEYEALYNNLAEGNYDTIEKYIVENENITIKSFSLKR